jgi:hypothetical protein
MIFGLSTKLAFHPLASVTKDQGSNPHMGRTLLDRHFVITAHSHAQLGKLTTRNRLKLIAQLAQ